MHIIGFHSCSAIENLSCFVCTHVVGWRICCVLVQSPFLSNSFTLSYIHVFFHCLLCLPQGLIKDPKVSSIVMNPHVKRSLKQKTLTDALSQVKATPITLNFIGEWLTRSFSMISRCNYKNSMICHLVFKRVNLPR